MPTRTKQNTARTHAEPEFFSRQIADARRFFLRLHAPWPETFNVVCGGSEHCSSDYHIARKNFPYVSVEFVAQGEGTLSLNGQTHALLTGSVFAYGPGVPHDIQCRPDKPMTKYFVALAGTQVLRHFARPGPRPGEIMQSSAPGHVTEIFEQLIDAGKRDTPFREAICRAIAMHLLLRLAESAVPPGTVGTAAFSTFQRCREWIERNYLTTESLEHIATACRIDEHYLCRLFKRYAHQSPWQHVLRLKMRDAAQQLQTRDVRVSDIAYEFGFTDPFQFSRTFHRIFGLSPRAFIRLHRREGGGVPGEQGVK
jgi:AraC-like DNA-binding protein